MTFISFLFKIIFLQFVNIQNSFDKTIKLDDVIDVTAQTFVVTTYN